MQELHAHLNGSVRDTTVRELYAQRSAACPELQQYTISDSDDRSLSECFELFNIVHAVTDSCDVIRRITAEVIEDFADDNVVYLELRTTARASAATGMTRQSYVESVIDVIEQYRTLRPEIVVKLLLSINRAHSAYEPLLARACSCSRSCSPVIVARCTAKKPWPWCSWL